MSNISNLKVGVTGSNGFLGKHLCSRLTKLGCTVIGCDSKRYNLTYRDECLQWLVNTPDVVIHAAGNVGGIQANQKHPGSFMYDNLIMGMHLIEGCRLGWAKRFIQIGTTCSYPDVIPMPFKEEDIWKGYPEPTNAPYGIAKRTLYELIDAYKKEYGFNGTSVVLANLYGPGDNFDPEKSHVIPALIKKIVDKYDSNDALVIDVWGRGNATRDFLYVEDAVDGIIKVLESDTKESIVNIGSGNRISINDVIRTILKVLGDPTCVLKYDTSKPDGQMKRVLDISKANKLGWEPTTTFEEGIRKTIEYFRNSKR